jgi:soluble lytic murein transglycosylase-like protein
MERSAPTQSTTITIPQIAATETMQGTTPLADGTYVQIAAAQDADLSRARLAAAQSDLKLIEERLPNGLTRILVPASTENLETKIDVYQRIEPAAKPKLIIKAQGKDSFSQYNPSLPQLATLEDYCKASNGRIENMPFYRAFEKAAGHASQEHDIGRFGFTKHTYMIRLMAITYAESSFNPRAQSPVGARGLMQLMDETVIWKKGNLSKVFDPEHNIQLGSEKYTSDLEFSKNEMKLKSHAAQQTTSLRAYNFGNGNVKKGKTTHETENYVRKVAANERLLLQYYPE